MEAYVEGVGAMNGDDEWQPFEEDYSTWERDENAREEERLGEMT